MEKPVKSPLEWIQAPLGQRTMASITVLEAGPGVLAPAVSVQGGWNRSRGIIRGQKEDGLLIEDHIIDSLDEQGRLVDSGHRQVGPDAIRDRVWTAQAHIAHHVAQYPEDRILAWTGNGNLLCNPHFVAFDGRAVPPVLYSLASEQAHLGRQVRDYSCCVVRKPGKQPRVGIETLRFEEGARVYDRTGEDITDSLEYAFYGQRLVSEGRAIDEDDLLAMVRCQEFYDLRHLFLFGRIELGNRRWIDAGLSAFWDQDGRMNVAAVERAIRGEAIVADVSQFPDQAIHQAMRCKSYRQVPTPVERGEYHLEKGTLRMVLLPGVYPHSAVGIGADGRLIVAAIGGLSNRVGVSIPGAAKIMKSLGAVSAVLIDNGRDVMMSVSGEMVTPVLQGHRDRLRSLLLYRGEPTATREDIRLTRYAGDA